MATKPLTQTTGRRKSAVSRVRLRPGSGNVTVNGRAFNEYFPTAIHRNNATEALRITSTLQTYDLDVDIVGGGSAGQSGAMRLAVARSLGAGSNASSSAEARRTSRPRCAQEGKQEVRSQEGAQGAAVHQALNRLVVAQWCWAGWMS